MYANHDILYRVITKPDCIMLYKHKMKYRDKVWTYHHAYIEAVKQNKNMQMKLLFNYSAQKWECILQNPVNLEMSMH